MKRCPRCGASVPETQQFCGSCGNPMPVSPVAPAPRVTPPVSEGQGSPYAYPQPVSPYTPGLPEVSNGQSPTMRYVVIGAVVLLVACCAFGCGIATIWIGDPLLKSILTGLVPPTPTPRGTRTPTPPGGGALIWILWYLLP